MHNWIDREIKVVIREVKRYWKGSWTPRIEEKLADRVRAALEKEAARGVRVVHE